MSGRYGDFLVGDPVIPTAMAFRVASRSHPPARWAVQHEHVSDTLYVCDGCLPRAMDIGINEVWELDEGASGMVPCYFDESNQAST